MRYFFKCALTLCCTCVGMVFSVMIGTNYFPPSDVIAFTSTLPHNDVYLLDVTHHITRSLTHSPLLERGLRWSPDGKRLAFINGLNSISVMDYRGNREQQYTQTRYYMRSVAWSVDGRDIYFTAAENGPIRMHVMAPEGDTREIETLPVDYHDLMWSPDGQKLTFASLHEGDHDIYVMDWLNSTLERLTERDRRDVSPSWSPDGRAIAFMSQESGEFELNIFDLETGATQPIVRIPDSARTPLWSHDGRTLFYASGRSIYAVNLDNSDLYEVIDVGLQIGGMALQPLLS